MKNIYFWIDKKEQERIPDALKKECENAGIGIWLSRGEDDNKIDREGLYVCSEESEALFLRSKGAAVLGYQDKGQTFSGFRWIMEPFEESSELELSFFVRVYQRYRKLPWDILETRRLLVRETTVDDVEDFYTIYAEPSITRYTEDLFENPAMEKAYTENYRDTIYDLYGFGMWTVLEKTSGTVIGRAGISMREGYDEPELGFIIGVPWQGRGYAYEVCEAILRYAKEELDFERVICFVKQENAASLGLCAKLGFIEKGMEQLGTDAYIMLRKHL